MTNIVHTKLIFLKILISLFLIGPVYATGPIKLAILDGGFCTENLPKHHLIKILPIFDATNTNPTNDCTKVETLHGYKILSLFIQQYKGKKQVEILPINIFDQTKNQSMAYWKNALKNAESNSYATIVAASGVPLLQKVQIKNEDYFPPSMRFILASGRKEGKLQKMVSLFPQDYLPKKQRTIVGSQIKFNESTLKDPMTHNPENVDIWIDESPNEPFKGSSRAVIFYVSDTLTKKIF